MTDISVTTTRSLSIPHHDWRDKSATTRWKFARSPDRTRIGLKLP